METGRTISLTRCPAASNNGVMELFRKVAHERGAGVVVVTHDQRSLDVFDRTFEMEDGVLSG